MCQFYCAVISWDLFDVLQPLIDCYMKLRDKGGLVCLKLTETWLREYQVTQNSDTMLFLMLDQCQRERAIFKTILYK